MRIPKDARERDIWRETVFQEERVANDPIQDRADRRAARIRADEYQDALNRDAALRELEAGRGSTRDFETLGLPFEAFLRWSQVDEGTRERAARSIRESLS